MATLEEGVIQLIRNCGNPAADVLSFEEATDFYLSALDYYLQMLTASDRFQAGVSNVFNPPAQDGAVGGPLPLTIPGYVEVEVNADNNRWTGISIVNVDDINDFADVGRFAIAFYGQPVQYRMSWDPTLSGERLRFWYSPEGLEAQTMQDIPALPRVFFQNMVPMRAAVVDAFPLLVLKDGAKYGPFCNMKLTTYATQLRQWDAQFESYVYENKDQGPVTIEPYNAGRENSGGFAFNYYPWDV